jgi:3-methyladenine DNA glycosylase Tag
MGDDVIIGYDGKPRCAWAGGGKRDAFRRAFHEFDVAQVAAMTARDVDRLPQDHSIIRNRAKIQATIENARAMRSASPTLAALASSYESTRKRARGLSQRSPRRHRRRTRSPSS